MTIITQESSGGQKRRCDGTCHRAKSPTCVCICGGRYHGKGNQAQEELTKDWLGENWREVKAEIEARGGDFKVVVTEAMAAAGGRAVAR